MRFIWSSSRLLATLFVVMLMALALAGCTDSGSAANASGGGGGSNCDENYEGACIDPNGGDVDCEGGEGDGPQYVGQVEVVGSDWADLDRDGDGIACDWG